MSSPNTTIAAGSLHILRNESSQPNAIGMKTIYVGREQTPTVIMEMAKQSAPGYQRRACFSQFYSTVISLADTHSVADLVSLVHQEVPITTTALFEEASLIKKTLHDAFVSPTSTNFRGLGFFDGQGQKIRFTKAMSI